MTATDPRPALAAMLAEKLAPAVEALATACAGDADPPPPDDRALADRHRAARARLDHLHKLLAVLDWAGAHLPEPEPREEPEEEPWEPPPAVKSDYDGGEDEFHYRSEVYVGSQETPGFDAWYAEQLRRFGPLVPDRDDYDGSKDVEYYGDRKYVGRSGTPEHRAWLERQDRREEREEALALHFESMGDDPETAERKAVRQVAMTKHDIA